MILRFILAPTVFFLLTINCFAQEINSSESLPQDATVAKVIDGDTLVLASGETVRLIGIDCPENEYSPAEAEYLNEGKKWERGPDSLRQAKEATDFVVMLVEGKEIRLEYDAESKDKSGRLLAYVFLKMDWGRDGHLKTKRVVNYKEVFVNIGTDEYLFINATIVKSGYALPKLVSPNIKYADLFQKLYR